MKLRVQIQELINSYPNCWVCGNPKESWHHTPPRSSMPKMFIRIPCCNRCHKLLNNVEYTAREKRTIRSNLRHMEKSIKNIRNKVLDKEAHTFTARHNEPKDVSPRTANRSRKRLATRTSLQMLRFRTPVSWVSIIDTLNLVHQEDKIDVNNRACLHQHLIKASNQVAHRCRRGQLKASGLVQVQILAYDVVQLGQNASLITSVNRRKLMHKLPMVSAPCRRLTFIA